MKDYKPVRKEDEADEAEDEHAVEYEKILEEIGFGKAQWSQLIICGLLTQTSLAVQTAVGIISIASKCDFEMNQSKKGIMMAACVTGICLSTYIWGYMCDIIGRRTVLVYATSIAGTLIFLSVFVTNYWFFNIINLLVGINIGGLSAAMYPYLSEFNTTKYRVVVINYATMFVSVAAIWVPAIAWFILSFDWSLDLPLGITLHPWRLVRILNLLPGLIGALWLRPFPESPKLLLAQNKEEAAIEAIDWICKQNRGRPLISVLGRTNIKLRPEKISEDDVINNESKGFGILILIWKATLPLFQRPHRRNFLISAAAVFLMFFSSNGMQVWYPEIVNRASEHVSNDSATICEMLDASFAKQALKKVEETSMECIAEKISRKTYIDNIIVGCAFFLSFAIQGVLLNALGRKNVLLGALSIATLSVFLLQFITNTTIALILFCLYIIMPSLAFTVMLGAVVDLVPTPLRGKASGICLTLGFFSDIIATNLIGITLEPMCVGTLSIFTISLLISIWLVCCLPIA